MKFYILIIQKEIWSAKNSMKSSKQKTELLSFIPSNESDNW